MFHYELLSSLGFLVAVKRYRDHGHSYKEIGVTRLTVSKVLSIMIMAESMVVCRQTDVLELRVLHFAVNRKSAVTLKEA